MFVTPIVVTQSLNIVIELVMPVLTKWRRERARAAADARAQARVREAGSMKILGALDYDHKRGGGEGGGAHFGNKSSTRYLEYTPQEIEVLNKKARAILFESEQDSYDPYNDLHMLTVQYGFTVMFSILWPLMPFACFLINTLKRRADGFRLCKTLKVRRIRIGLVDGEKVMLIVVLSVFFCFSSGPFLAKRMVSARGVAFCRRLRTLRSL